MLKDSFRTTNCIENVNRLLAQLIHNVRRWTNSSQRHRWVATALLDIEPRLRRVRGFHPLPMLRQAIQAELRVFQVSASKWALIASMRARAFSLVGSGTLEGVLPQESIRASAATAFSAMPNLRPRR